MLTVMKTTHNNKTNDVWAKIPLQDFTLNSNIDWSKSISEIDQQLYKKYDLSEEEISFIESMIKPMA
jgi:type II restriction enzyme